MIKYERDINRIPFEESMVVGRIVDVKVLFKKNKNFAITIEVLNGSHAGALLYDDKFHCTEEGKYYWKFQKLMIAINKCKYDDDIDLEKALLNKYVFLVLTIFKTEDRFGKPMQFQNISYLSCYYSTETLQKLTINIEEKLKQKYEKLEEENNTQLHTDSPFLDIGPFTNI